MSDGTSQETQVVADTNELQNRILALENELKEQRTLNIAKAAEYVSQEAKNEIIKALKNITSNKWYDLIGSDPHKPFLQFHVALIAVSTVILSSGWAALPSLIESKLFLASSSTLDVMKAVGATIFIGTISAFCIQLLRIKKTGNVIALTLISLCPIVSGYFAVGELMHFSIDAPAVQTCMDVAPYCWWKAVSGS